MPYPDFSPRRKPRPMPAPSPTPYRPDPAHAPRLEPGDGDSLILVKADQRHVFACPPGGEAALLDRLSTLVADPANNLTWFDAAVISHEVGRRMAQRLDIRSHLPGHPPDHRKSA